MSGAEPDVTPGQRRSALWLGLGLGGMSALACWLAAGDLWSLVTGVRGHMPIVTVWLGATTALPAGVSMLLVAVILIASPGARLQHVLFLAVLAGLALAVMLPFALSAATASLLPGQGYRRCEHGVPGMRLPAHVWVREPMATCPRVP